MSYELINAAIELTEVFFLGYLAIGATLHCWRKSGEKLTQPTAPIPAPAQDAAPEMPSQDDLITPENSDGDEPDHTEMTIESAVALEVPAVVEVQDQEVIPAPAPKPRKRRTAAKKVQPAATTIEVQPSLEGLGIRQLRVMAREKGLKGFMKLSKSELVTALA